jgi:hypothetical protein
VSIRAPAGPRAPTLPSPPRAPAPARLRGAPRLPRVSGAPPPPPWETIPTWWRARFPAAPVTEWYVWWALVNTYKFRPPYGPNGPTRGRPDFLYQVPIPIPGLNRTGAERSDLWLLPGSPAIIVPPYSKGTVGNPISLYTHPDAGKDRRERGLMGQYGWLEIFMDEMPLTQDPIYVVGQFVQGRDISSRRG